MQDKLNELARAVKRINENILTLELKVSAPEYEDYVEYGYKFKDGRSPQDNGKPMYFFAQDVIIKITK